MSNRSACLAATTMLLLGLAAPSAYAARTFCCTDEKGQQRCGDVLPDACRSRAYVEYNEAGTRVRNVAAPLTEAQQAAKNAEEKKKREMAEAAEQQRRADQALLSTYADEKDLDTARDRAVNELVRSIKSAEDKLADLNKAKAKLAADTEFFKNKPLPADLKQKIARNQTALQEQQAAINLKKKEIEETRAKFDGYYKRLHEMKAKDKDVKS
ncbi:hypothetical protein [Georgfuchsia toluolica]|nr:hypothetical protein [Georgfuchsia toluolica]